MEVPIGLTKRLGDRQRRLTKSWQVINWSDPAVDFGAMLVFMLLTLAATIVGIILVRC